jgi:hypothetical protein
MRVRFQAQKDPLRPTTVRWRTAFRIWQSGLASVEGGTVIAVGLHALCTSVTWRACTATARLQYGLDIEALPFRPITG